MILMRISAMSMTCKLICTEIPIDDVCRLYLYESLDFFQLGVFQMSLSIKRRGCVIKWQVNLINLQIDLRSIGRLKSS